MDKMLLESSLVLLEVLEKDNSLIFSVFGTKQREREAMVWFCDDFCFGFWKEKRV